MNDLTHAAALRADFASSHHESAGQSVGGRLWGAVCGATFVAARASIYLIALPFAAIACVAGLALYAVQGVARHG
jgi:hypothetical protein